MIHHFYNITPIRQKQKVKSVHMRILFFILALGLVAQTASAEVQIPKIRYFSNKLVDAWDNVDYADDINERPENDELSIAESRRDKINYDRIARWRPTQAEFALRSYKYLLQNGLEKDRGWFNRTLGAIGIVTGYDYTVEPTFSEGYFTRSDKFVMRPVLNIPFTLKEMAAYKADFSVSPGYEIEYGFYRQFSSSKKAILAKPYFHRNLPFDAKHAIQGLKPYDVFRFRGKLDMMFDTSVVTDLLTVPSGFSVGAYYVATGNFEVFIIRLPQNKVQMRVLGYRRNTVGAHGAIGIDEIKVLGIGLLDSGMKKALDPNFLTVELEKQFNNGLVVDYVIDLNDPKAAKAFDESLLKVREFNYMEVIDPRVSNPEFKHDVLVNFAALEQERQQSESIRRVYNFGYKGNTGERRFTLGNNILQFGYDTHNSENEFVADDATYVVKTRQTEQSSRFLYSLFKNNTHSKTTYVEEKGTEEKSVILSSEINDKRFSKNDLARSKKKLERFLPDVYSQLDFSIFDNEKLGAVGIKTLVNFNGQSLSEIPVLTRKDIQARYLKYASRFETYDIAGNDIHGAVSAAAKLLEKMMKATSINEKFDHLMKLNKQRFFKATGPGFLMSLMPSEVWKEQVNIEMEMNSTAGMGFTYSSGPTDMTELYSSLIHYENLLNGEEFELHMLLESLQENHHKAKKEGITAL